MAHVLKPTSLRASRRAILRRLDWPGLPVGRVPGLWTEKEYLAVETHRRIEFTDGVIEVLPVPTLIHQTLQNLIWQLLYALQIDGQRGTATTAGFKLRLRRGKWREPDVLYMKPSNASRVHNEAWTYADFVVEIVSEGGSARDRVRKRREYARWGVPEYWIIDPRERTLLQLVLDPGATEYREVGTFGPADVVRAVTLSGFEVDFGALLAEAVGPAAEG